MPWLHDPTPLHMHALHRDDRRLLLSPLVAQSGSDRACRNCKNAPIIISYGHYPLGTAYNGQAVKHVLMHHHVSAYLAGHLHSSVGQRTHRLHPAEDHAGAHVTLCLAHEIAMAAGCGPCASHGSLAWQHTDDAQPTLCLVP